MHSRRTSSIWAAASLLCPLLLLATPAHADIPNEPPSVSITSPTDGQMFEGPTATIDVMLDASPGDEGINSIRLLVDDTPLLIDNDMPYGFEDVEITEGMHTLTAVVVSTTGDEFPSEPVEIVVLAAEGETSGAETSGPGTSGGDGSGGDSSGTMPEAKGCTAAAGTQVGAALMLAFLFGLAFVDRRREGR